jgi:Protein of unknown function (DUF3592)
MYGFLIILFIGLPFCIYGAYVLRSHSKLKYWPTVEGKLVELEFGLDFETGRYGKFYYRFPKPTYEYQVDGIKYFGNQVNHDIKSTWIAVEKPNQQPNFYCEIGGLLTVHYNPKNPAKSVLQVALPPKRKSHYLAICVTGILLIATSVTLAIYTN